MPDSPEDKAVLAIAHDLDAAIGYAVFAAIEESSLDPKRVMEAHLIGLNMSVLRLSSMFLEEDGDARNTLAVMLNCADQAYEEALK